MTADSKPLIISEAPETGLPRGVQCIVQPVARNSRLLGLLIAGDKQSGDPGVTSFDIHLLETAGAFIAAVLENGALYAEQSAMFIGSLKALTSSLDAKDRYTAGHSERVACLARQLALALGLPENIAERVHIAGMVHDVGKIGVPEAVLLKPGKPTEAEFAMIKRHPEIGYAILKDIPLMQDILPGVLHHHERYDGKGYPSGLAGEQIPLFGRILAIADTFDAMSSNRSYRPALGRQQVIAELQRCAGTQLDPALVPVFLSLDLSFFDRLMAAHRDHVTDVAARAA
ncbi:MAG: HD domain-containing phosphohydrolase [bacterium]